MNITSYIARRYFFSAKSGHAVNIISAISMLGILVGTASLIIVLSAFNGLEKLVKSFYLQFDPDIKISLVEGKYFDEDSSMIRKIEQTEGVSRVSVVLEERVLLTFRDKEYIATVKGVDGDFPAVSGVEEALLAGEYGINDNSDIPTSILGAGVAYYLGYSRADFDSPVSAYVPREKSGMDFSTAFASDLVYPSGIFRVEPGVDEKYMLTSLGFIRKLLDRPKAMSAFELSLGDGADTEKVKDRLKALLGNGFRVQDRNEQQEVFFKVMQSENLFTFLVFALILAISTFTIMGSITMLMLDKKRDLYTFWAVGADVRTLRTIFFKEGLLISLVGALSGLFLGVLIVLLQKYLGLLSLGEGYAIADYPVELAAEDVLLVSMTVLVLSTITSWITSRRLDLKLVREREG